MRLDVSERDDECRDIRSAVANAMAAILVDNAVDVNDAGAVVKVLYGVGFGSIAIANLMDQAIEISRTLSPPPAEVPAVFLPSPAPSDAGRTPRPGGAPPG